MSKETRGAAHRSVALPRAGRHPASHLRLARRLRVPYRTALDLLRSGKITSWKEKCVWVAEAATVQRFKRGNDRKIEKLRSDYVRLYWEGLSPDRLQARVRDDIARRGIVCTVANFAEQAIYADLMKERDVT